MPVKHELPITRYDLVTIINERGYRYGAEIGVEHGYFSYYLLKHSNLEELSSIDSYRGKFSKWKQDAISHLVEFGSRSKLYTRSSIAAAEAFPLGWLDFVYIDAHHSKESVAADIATYWPKIRPRGLLAGHDYCDVPNNGVIAAVDEFADSLGLHVMVTREAWASWMIYKPSSS